MLTDKLKDIVPTEGRLSKKLNGPSTLQELFDATPKPTKMDELFQNSKERVLFERLNKSLQDAVAQINEKTKETINKLVPKLVNEKFAELSPENLEKNIQGIVEDAQSELEKTSDKLLTETTKSLDRAAELKDKTFIEFKKGISEMVKDASDTISAIKGTSEEEAKKLSEIKNKLELLEANIPHMIRSYKQRGGGGGGSTIRVDNLSSQANGSTRTFTTTYKIGVAHLLFYSSAPFVILPTTDYTVSGTTVTISSSLDAPVAGQSLALIYEESA